MDEEEDDPSPPMVRSEDSLLAEQLMRDEMEQAGMGRLLESEGAGLAASLALAMELMAAGQFDEAQVEGPDVDSMTYEELIALGERIGTVSVGASEAQLREVLRPMRDQSVRAAQASGDVCAVCMEPFGQGGTPSQLPCKHIFHEECIAPHLRQHRACPICRVDCIEAMQQSPLAKWRAAQQERLATKEAAAAEEALREKLREAQQAIDGLYEERRVAAARRAATNREEQDSYASEYAALDHSWASVRKLIQRTERLRTDAPTVDTSRMRALLMQL
ncbi:hypothetical protein AB1Y20_005888 [Prymnesium parvum]|uniref:Clathrin light chain n=1 Tax=Prymnesium parvum TaxID=97485 RepID=A0AB34J2H8_PRYPA